MHLVSLDAAKAIDKLWRAGLFFKLKDVIDPVCQRMIFEYYSESFINVCFNGIMPDSFRKNEGVEITI